MLTQSDWEPIVRTALEETNKIVDRLVENFSVKLEAWLDDILNSPIPDDWRDELAAFIQRTADDDNLAIAPHSITTLEQIIESCIAGTDEFAHWGPAPRAAAKTVVLAQQATTVAPKVSEPPIKPQPLPPLVGYPKIPTGPRGTSLGVDKLFDQQLASAKQHLAVLDQLLKAAGEKIDAAKPGEDADVEYEADMVRKHLFLYNEDLAVARDLWLRFSLSGDANSRLIAMHTPVGLGLPMFASPAQAQRMGQQLAAIGRRLRGANASMDALVTGMEATEMAANAATIVAGAGLLIAAAKKGGTWAVVKTAAVGYAIYIDTKIAESVLHDAGASDQTIRGAQLAAAVITLILLHKVEKRTATQKGTTTEPGPSACAPRSNAPKPSPAAAPGRGVPEQPVPGIAKMPIAVRRNIPTAQLEKKWKHAADFGITTQKRNPTTLAEYGEAIASHLDDAATIKKGTYLYVPDSKVYFNPNTNLVVVLDKNGFYVSGWKLAPGTPQFQKFLKDGILR